MPEVDYNKAVPGGYYVRRAVEQQPIIDHRAQGPWRQAGEVARCGSCEDEGEAEGEGAAVVCGR